jgi:hypothetical protein
LGTASKYRILACRGRGADTVSATGAVLGLCECVRVLCMGACMGSVRPYSLAQKVPWGITSMQYDIQVMLGGCACRERPWALFCDWVYTCDRQWQVGSWSPP